MPETSASETGISFSAAAANDSSSSLLLLKPPPGSEVQRSASVSSAVPRPRPQVVNHDNYINNSHWKFKNLGLQLLKHLLFFLNL